MIISNAYHGRVSARCQSSSQTGTAQHLPFTCKGLPYQQSVLINSLQFASGNFRLSRVRASYVFETKKNSSVLLIGLLFPFHVDRIRGVHVLNRYAYAFFKISLRSLQNGFGLPTASVLKRHASFVVTVVDLHSI